MSIKKTIGKGLVALGLAIPVLYAGIKCDKRSERLFEESKRPIIGTVLEENYKESLSPVPERDGLVSYSNETVKLDSKYTLKVKTDDGRILGLSIIDGKSDWGGKSVKKEALDMIIERGTRISFPAGNLRHGNCFAGVAHREYPNETYFTPKTQAGNKRADRIKVLE